MEREISFYSVRFCAAATREFRKLERSAQERLDGELRQLESQPRPSGCRKLQPGHLERYRVRVGEWRIVYEVDDRERRVEILVIGDRKEVYR